MNGKGVLLQIPTQNIKIGLPKPAKTLCPDCLNVIDGMLIEKNNKVFMEKTCDEHGYFIDCVSTDAEWYKRNELWSFQDNSGIENPNVTENTYCPKDCGLCSKHVSTACLTNIDLTNRCNMKCPICFANANSAGYVYELSLEQIRKMLEVVKNVKPVFSAGIQYSGGEPTIHPKFIEILKLTKKMGFSHIQVASNGIRFANDLEFTKECKEAGLVTVYLQFDGVDDKVFKKTRNIDNLTNVKLRAVQNIRKAGMKVCLVPTLIKGINDDQIGKIIKFAVDNVDTITAISWQPIVFTGRMSHEERIKQRFTLADVAKKAEEAGYCEMYDWYPMSFVSPFSRLLDALSGKRNMIVTCHSHCGIGTYLFVNKETKEVVPITRVLDVEKAMVRINELADEISRTNKVFRSWSMLKVFSCLKKYYKEDEAPEGLTFAKFLKLLYGLTNKKMRLDIMKEKWAILLMAGMHFQDSYNYEVDRVKRCVIHYATPDGKIYPFCTYNSGPYYREKIEKQFSVPIKEWVKHRSGEYVTEGFVNE